MSVLQARWALRAAGGGVTPRQFLGLKLWLDASTISGLVDSDPVTTWTDLSGNGNNATQSTAAAKPTYKTSVINGRPVVRFDGVDDYLTSTGVVSGFAAQDQPLTVFTVVKANDISVNRALWSLGSSVSNYPYLWHYIAATSPNYNATLRDDAASATKDFPTSALPYSTVANAVATTLVTTGTSGSLYVNGTLLNAAADVDVGVSTFTYLGIGAQVRSTDINNFLSGDIAEIVVYNRALTADERQQVERYLGNKWGTIRFSPKDLSGLTMWLDANSLNLSDNSAVTTWTDISGSSNSALQGTAGFKPVYKTGVVNGRPAVLFDGVDDFMSLTAGAQTAMLAGDKSVFAAVKWVSTAGVESRVLSVADGAFSTRFALRYTTGPVYGVVYTTGVAQASITATAGNIPSTSAAQILEVVQSGASLTARTNGTQLAANPSNAGTEAAVYGSIGSGPTGADLWGNLYICEVAVYNRALSTSEASQVRSYLGTKYGVTVA